MYTLYNNNLLILLNFVQRSIPFYTNCISIKRFFRFKYWHNKIFQNLPMTDKWQTDGMFGVESAVIKYLIWL